ncbi:hydrogenase maturation nickel metallochaperone HypA [Eubacteriaceae bacterium ES2]|nr:hydrogenase maturation nickel metallochaperone HypA [Eubacteriaceae bacterium ES2]
MHEMGVVLNIVREAEKQGKYYNIKKIGSLTLQIGELTGVETHFVYSCWSPAIKDTILEGAELKVEEVEGLVSCQNCGCDYRFLDNLIDNQPVCPECQSSNWQLKQGRDVMIKEIGVFDE